MALASRNARRGAAGLRWLAVGVALTLLILLIDASLKSRSPAPRQQLAAGIWVDRVLPVIARSTDEGRQIAGIWSHGLSTPGPALASTLDSVATEAAQNYQTVVKLRPPETLLGPAGLLEAALLARSQAAASLQKAIVATLGSAGVPAPSPGSRSSGSRSAAPSSATSSTTATSATTASAPSTTVPSAPRVGAPPASEVSKITTAGSEIQVGDSAYSLFAGSVPPGLGVHMPASTWATNPSAYSPQTVEVFLSSLQAALVTTPVHQVKVLAVTLNPAAVSANGAVQVLPDASSITATVVVADTGNQPESNLTVTAAISPPGKGTSSVRDFVNLSPGQAYTITGLGPLNPTEGQTVTLTVTVSPGPGSATQPASTTLAFSMPAPPPPTTTTTTTTNTTKH